MSTKKGSTKPTENPESALTECADFIMNSFNSPSCFLEFLNESLFWVESFNRGREVNESVFFVNRMIENVILPWIKGTETVRNNIVAGLGEIYKDAGYEGYLKEVSTLLQGFAIFCGESPYFDTKKHLLSFDNLFGISFYIGAHNDELNKKQKAGILIH